MNGRIRILGPMARRQIQRLFFGRTSSTLGLLTAQLQEDKRVTLVTLVLWGLPVTLVIQELQVDQLGPQATLELRATPATPATQVQSDMLGRLVILVTPDIRGKVQQATPATPATRDTPDTRAGLATPATQGLLDLLGQRDPLVTQGLHRILQDPLVTRAIRVRNRM